jgi:hypothetical protein
MVRGSEPINKMLVTLFPRQATPNKLDGTYTNGTIEKGGEMVEEEDDARSYLREESLEAEVFVVGCAAEKWSWWPGWRLKVRGGGNCALVAGKGGDRGAHDARCWRRTGCFVAGQWLSLVRAV